MIRFKIIMRLLFFLVLAQSCRDDNRNSKKISDENATSNEVIEPNLESVNFFLENSGSMNGYANGYTDFKKSIVRLLSDIDQMLPNSDSVNVNMINMKPYPYNKSYSEFNRDLTVSGIPQVGDITKSDINLIFNNILANTNLNEVSILVTDAIYSLNGKNCDELIGLLETESYNTRNLFFDRLGSTNLSTLVLKMESNFDGYYYPAQGGSISINQKRPYYIWFFGDSKLLKGINDNIKLTTLPGYINDFYVLKTNTIKVDYSILEYGEGNIGAFENSNMHEYPITTINYGEKEKRGENIGEFGFAVAIDLENIDLPETYLRDVNKYADSSPDYEIYNIVNITDQITDEKTIKSIKKTESETGANFTHLIYVKSKAKIIQNFTISIRNDVSSWVEETGLNCDSNIEGDTSNTFGFDQLTNGIIKAYEKINKTKDYFLITISVKS